jgi:transposase
MRTRGKGIFEGPLTIGLDLGDRFSSYRVLDENGEILLEQKLATTPEAMRRTFGKMAPCRIAMETGTHSPWVSRPLAALGHEVIVAHAQKVRGIVQSRRKDDRLDARTRARLARDPELLSPVQHRSAPAQLHRTEIRARAGLVSARTALLNAARRLVKSYGERLRRCGTQRVRRETTSGLSTGLREAQEPLLQAVESLHERIQEYDRRIATMAQETDPETALLKQVQAWET